MRSLRAFSVGGSAPNPPRFTAFFRQNGLFLLCFKGTGSTCPPAFPAAESVARVASQHCPIPSGSGRLIINRAARALNEKAANGKYPLNFVSHIWAHRMASLFAADHPQLFRRLPGVASTVQVLTPPSETAIMSLPKDGFPSTILEGTRNDQRTKSATEVERPTSPRKQEEPQV